MENNEIGADNRLLAQIHIVTGKGGDICFLYELEKLKAIVAKTDINSYETFLNVGDKFRFEDGDYVIINITTKFRHETFDDFNHGVSMSKIGEQFPFNLTIIYVVKKV